jgi:hypothetical protein
LLPVVSRQMVVVPVIITVVVENQTAARMQAGVSQLCAVPVLLLFRGSMQPPIVLQSFPAVLCCEHNSSCAVPWTSEPCQERTGATPIGFWVSAAPASYRPWSGDQVVTRGLHFTVVFLQLNNPNLQASTSRIQPGIVFSWQHNAMSMCCFLHLRAW